MTIENSQATWTAICPRIFYSEGKVSMPGKGSHCNRSENVVDLPYLGRRSTLTWVADQIVSALAPEKRGPEAIH